MTTDNIPSVPILARLAGYIWLVFGGGVLLVGFGFLHILFEEPDWTMKRRALHVGFVLLFEATGAGFVYVGRQTTTGRARDTIGNGLGSLALGILLAARG